VRKNLLALSREEFLKRVMELEREESKHPLRWFYISFAGPKFLGAVIVRGRGPSTALRESHRLKINPGGEAVAFACGFVRSELGDALCNPASQAAQALRPANRFQIVEAIGFGFELFDYVYQVHGSLT
jgi:hypothetical protein